jgi:catechol 2,3-dioxygenase-like lactoylglutathione lyase family enzyme
MADLDLTDIAPAPGIPARLSGVFVVATGVAALRTFYEGLGWRSTREDHAFVPFPLSGASFSLWETDIAADHLDDLAAASIGFTGAVLGVVVDEPDEVDAAAAAAIRAGGRVVSPPAATPFGRSLWFVDPGDHVWEVSWIDGMSSTLPFSGSPTDDATLPHLDRVIVLAADVDELCRFYTELGWTLLPPPDGASGADVVLGPIILSLRDVAGIDGAVTRALERDGLPERRVLLAMEVAPELVSPGVEELVAAGATPLVVDGAGESGGPGRYVIDVVGMPWAVLASAPPESRAS